jgi:hypothetical protein
MEKSLSHKEQLKDFEKRKKALLTLGVERK